MLVVQVIISDLVELKVHWGKEIKRPGNYTQPDSEVRKVWENSSKVKSWLIVFVKKFSFMRYWKMLLWLCSSEKGEQSTRITLDTFNSKFVNYSWEVGLFYISWPQCIYLFR